MKRNLHAGQSQSGGNGLNLFTEDELNAVHLATLEVLEKTGLFVESEEALSIFDGGGAWIDYKNKIVKIPPHLVEESVRLVPSTLTLHGRDPAHDVVIEDKRVGFTNFGAGIAVVDPDTLSVRDSTNKDLADSARLVDSLEHMDVYYRALSSLDAPENIEQLYNARAIFPNTTKHVFIGGINTYLLNRIVNICSQMAGGRAALRRRPFFTFVTSPVSPLKLVDGTCDNIIGAARNGIAVCMISMPMAGATSPIRLAGNLVCHNAEILGGTVLSQLVSKGAKVIYGASNIAMDMRYGTCPVGSPEAAKLNAAVARLARYYGMPSLVAGG